MTRKSILIASGAILSFCIVTAVAARARAAYGDTTGPVTAHLWSGTEIIGPFDALLPAECMAGDFRCDDSGDFNNPAFSGDLSASQGAAFITVSYYGATAGGWVSHYPDVAWVKLSIWCKDTGNVNDNTIKTVTEPLPDAPNGGTSWSVTAQCPAGMEAWAAYKMSYIADVSYYDSGYLPTDHDCQFYIDGDSGNHLVSCFVPQD